jgi:radical SAM superfamily enzyme YgiQ (UPF0313 family)
MRILFANVPAYTETTHTIKAGSRWPFIFDSPKPPKDTAGYYNTYPFFLGYAAAFLALNAKVGEVHFIDALARAWTYDEFYSYVKDLKPDIVVIETSTPSIENDLQVAEVIKSYGCETALTGPHATVYANDLIKRPSVDYILQGEYEIGALEMCLMRKKGIYKCRPVTNIDTFPFPPRDESIFLYADGFGQDQHIKYPQLQILTSRGCPYHCNYCLWNDTMTYQNYRKRNIKNISQEITNTFWRFSKFRSILLDDDIVNVGDERTIEISEMMAGFGVQWHAMVRADSCSKEAFYAMRVNGCEGLKIGVESFSQRGLDYVKKGYNSTELIETIDYLIGLGFKVFLSLMAKIPTETEEDKAFTQKWLEYFVTKGASFQQPNYMPLPGTQIFNELNAEGRIKTDDWGKYGRFHTDVPYT